MRPKLLSDLEAGWFRVVRLEGDLVGRRSVLEKGPDGLDPVCCLVGSGLLAAADRGPAERGVVPGGVAGFDVAAAVEQEANGMGAAVLGGGVEWGAAVVAAGVEREAEVEHQADRSGVAVFGRAEDCGALLVGQPFEQSWIIVE